MNPKNSFLIVAAALMVLPAGLSYGAESVASVDAMVDGTLITENSDSPASPVAGQKFASTKTALLFPKRSKDASAIITEDQKDKLAKIYEVKGKVQIARKGSTKWKKAKKDLTINEGDMILTGKNGAASITFDSSFMNITHIPKNTRAIFRSVEPTDIYLEDGTLYNFFDGLPENSNWKVSTPTAVAAVRGTHFLANYTASNGQVVSAVFDVPEDGHLSAVSLIDVLEDGEEGVGTDIPEGKQINLKAGETPDPSLLTGIDAHWLEQIQNILEDLAQKRGEQSGVLPPTGGEEGANDALNAVIDSARNEAQNAFQPQDLIDPNQGNEPETDITPIIDEQEPPHSGEGEPEGGEGEGGGENEPPRSDV